MPTLAELRTTPPTNRPRRTLTVCLDGDVADRHGRLNAQYAALLNGQATLKPGVKARLAELAGELDALSALMEQSVGELTFHAAWTGGEWRTFVDENPPRAKGEPGHDRDQRVTVGTVNTDALIERLGEFLFTWNDEPTTPGDWDTLFATAIGEGSTLAAANAVVHLYQEAPDFNLTRVVLSETRDTLIAYAQPETSESVTDDSTAGSPEPSATLSTETGTESA